MVNLPWIRLDVELLYVYLDKLTKLKDSKNEVFEGENKEDLTVVLDVGDDGLVLGLGGGVVGELKLNLGVD